MPETNGVPQEPRAALVRAGERVIVLKKGEYAVVLTRQQANSLLSFSSSMLALLRGDPKGMSRLLNDVRQRGRLVWEGMTKAMSRLHDEACDCKHGGPMGCTGAPIRLEGEEEFVDVDRGGPSIEVHEVDPDEESGPLGGLGGLFS